MADTEISKINNKICEKIIKFKIIILLIEWPDDPRSDSNRCPAIMFAVRRIDKVNGRIIKLIDSIITINGIKIKGVPWGVRCLNRSLR